MGLRRGRAILRPQGLRVPGPGRARQVRLGGRVRPGRPRGRRRLRHGRMGRRSRSGATAGSALWGESYYGSTSYAAADQRPSGDRMHRAGRYRPGPAGALVASGRAAAEHRPATGRWRWTPASTATCRQSTRTTCRSPTWPASSGSRGTSSAARSSMPTMPGGSAAVLATTSTGFTCPVLSLGRLVRQLHRPAPRGLRPDRRSPPCARDSPSAGRAVGSRGHRRLHRPGGVRACRRPRQHRWDALLRRSSTATCATSRTASGATGRVDVFTLGRTPLAARSGSWPPPGVECRPPFYLRAGGRLAFEPPVDGEPPAAYRYDPLNPVAETVGRNCWGLCTALDDRRRLDDREDILRYVSDPLEHDLELLGPIEAESACLNERGRHRLHGHPLSRVRRRHRQHRPGRHRAGPLPQRPRPGRAGDTGRDRRLHDRHERGELRDSAGRPHSAWTSRPATSTATTAT